MKKFLFIFILLLNLNADTIQSITYKGLNYLSANAANELCKISIGQQMDDEIANRVIKTLFSQGYFKDIYINDNDGHIIIHVVEKPIIARIDIKGVVTNDEKAINSILNIKKGQMYDELSSKTAMERVRQFYESKGYFDTIVSENIVPLSSENSIHLTYQVNRGENIIIKKVNLVGAKVKKYNQLEPFVENKEREFLGWMWGRNDGAVKIFELAGDSERIKEEYLKSGYLDAKISRAYLNTNFESYTADLTYYIDEGQRYRVGDIEIEASEDLGIDFKKALKDLKLKKGKIFNVSWLRKDTEKLENLVASKGYAYARVLPFTAQDSFENVVHLKYQVMPNEQVYIRNIIISGNEKTLDRVIRREMYLTEGELYNKIDLRDSINALKRTGYFEDVNIKEQRINDNQMDLEVEIQETTTGAISGGIGYGSGEGLLLSAGISESNLFGSGYQGSFRGTKDKYGLNGTLSLVNPRVLDSAYSLGGSVYANNWEWSEYRDQNYGFRVTAGRQLGRYVNSYLSYQFQRTKISGLNPFYKEAGYLNGTKYKSSVIPGISWNNTDDFYLPRSGFILGTSVEFAGLGGDVEFTKNETNFSLYKGLEDYINWDLIFRYKAGFSYLWNNDTSKLPINEKFFLGGLGSIRGYDYRSLTPKSRICNPIGSDGKPIPFCVDIETGGKMAFNNSVELSWPIINRIKMRGVAFFDYGMIGQNSLNEIKRSSAGIGIEWMTIIGPLQVSFVKPLDSKKGDKTNHFEFSIGQRF